MKINPHFNPVSLKKVVNGSRSEENPVVYFLQKLPQLCPPELPRSLSHHSARSSPHDALQTFSVKLNTFKSHIYVTLTLSWTARKIHFMLGVETGELLSPNTMSGGI